MSIITVLFAFLFIFAKRNSLADDDHRRLADAPVLASREISPATLIPSKIANYQTRELNRVLQYLAV